MHTLIRTLWCVSRGSCLRIRTAWQLYSTYISALLYVVHSKKVICFNNSCITINICYMLHPQLSHQNPINRETVCINHTWKAIWYSVAYNSGYNNIGCYEKCFLRWCLKQCVKMICFRCAGHPVLVSKSFFTLYRVLSVLQPYLVRKEY